MRTRDVERPGNNWLDKMGPKRLKSGHPCNQRNSLATSVADDHAETRALTALVSAAQNLAQGAL